MFYGNVYIIVIFRIGSGGGPGGIFMYDQSNMGEVDVSFSFPFVFVVIGHEREAFSPPPQSLNICRYVLYILQNDIIKEKRREG